MRANTRLRVRFSNISSQHIKISTEMFDGGLVKTLGPSAFVVYLLLVRRCDVDMCCFPSLNGISKDTGLSKPTVITAISKLEAAGLLVVERTFDSAGGPTRNRYNLMILDDKGVVKNLAYLVKKFNYPSKENIPPPSKAVLPQEVLNTSISTTRDTTKSTSIKERKSEPEKIKPLFDDDEAPTKDRISASARNKRDAELREAYNRIHEIAGLPKPISFPKSDQGCLIGALREGATVDRLGIAWQRALETSEAKYWPFHCVIEKLPSLEATKRPQQQPRQTQSSSPDYGKSIRETINNALAEMETIK